MVSGTHIETIQKGAYKIFGIMQKLKYSFSRQALNQMYVSYVRPLLEYSSIVWDVGTEQGKTAYNLERFQNEAARKVTGLTRSNSIVNLHRECDWDSLANRRCFQKMCFMYKCSNNLVPDNISDIIPSRVAEVSNYPLRNRDNISNVNSRTETACRSCIPSAVTHWNSLRTNVREADTYLSFRRILKDEVLRNTNVPS